MLIRGLSASISAPEPSLLLRGLRLGTRTSNRLRGSWLKLRIRATGGQAGNRLSVGSGLRLKISQGSRCCIGDRVEIGTGVIMSIGVNAHLIIGNDVRITHYTIIAAEERIFIADRAQVGEHSSIRDHEHDISAQSMHAAAVVSAPVSIREDSWIGRGVAVLKGSNVGAGAVIGANAVVRGEIPQNSMAVGVPARVIRHNR